MHFSNWAWCGVGRFFLLLDKIGYTRPIRWNSDGMKLERNRKPERMKWVVGSLLVTINFLILPTYFYLEHILSSDTERCFNTPQAVLLVFCFAFGIMSLPAFIHMIRTANQLIMGFNRLIQLEKHVRGKKHFQQNQDL
jgi:RsiW-degrading membrane proteinase PrsW (M82 family)